MRSSVGTVGVLDTEVCTKCSGQRNYFSSNCTFTDCTQEANDFFYNLYDY